MQKSNFARAVLGDGRFRRPADAAIVATRKHAATDWSLTPPIGARDIPRD